jgi:putative hydrolase of the HAD superfamily
MSLVVDWKQIDTVLLDMDGTLLDLHFDNHFWQVYVPRKFAEQHGLPHAEAHAECFRRYDAKAGTLDWYCVDYWTQQLELDIVRLKQELSHLIAVHPDVTDFLAALKIVGKSLNLKMDRTGLAVHFDAMHVSHEYGIAKEDPSFWHALQQNEPFDPERTLLIDDSLPVLRSARAFGIAHLLAIMQPDTRQPDKDVADFAAIRRFGEITPSISLTTEPPKTL